MNAISSILATVDPEVSPSTLLSIRTRAACPQCGSMQQWYCYFCHLLTNAPSFNFATPPIPVTFLCYRGEKNSKSSVHGVVTSSRNVTVQYFSEEVEDGSATSLEEGSVLLMAGRGAKKVAEVQWDKVHRIYILDCTWNQVNKCMRQLGLPFLGSSGEMAAHASNVQLVELGSYTSIFWRKHNQKNDNCLSSAEALYYMLFELNKWGLATQNLDNILTFFLAQAVLIYKNNPWVNKQIDTYNKELAELFKRRWNIDMCTEIQSSSIQDKPCICCPRCGGSTESFVFRGTNGCVLCFREELKTTITKTIARCPVFFPGGKFLVLSFSDLCLDAFRNSINGYLSSIVTKLDDVMVIYNLNQHDDKCTGYFSILNAALRHAQTENIPLVFDLRDSNSVASTVVHSAILGDLGPGIASAEESLEYPDLPIDIDVAYKLYLSNATRLYKPRRKIGHVSLFRPFLSIPERVLKCYASSPLADTTSPSAFSLISLPEEKQHLMTLLRDLIPSPEAVCGLAKKIEWRAQPNETPCPLCGVALDDNGCICNQL